VEKGAGGKGAGQRRRRHEEQHRAVGDVRQGGLAQVHRLREGDEQRQHDGQQHRAVGNVKDDLAGCFEHYASAHKSILTSAVAVSKRLYDSGIHKTFCNEIRACGGGDDGGTDDDLGDDVDDDDDEEEEEAEVIDHDEM